MEDISASSYVMFRSSPQNVYTSQLHACTKIMAMPVIFPQQSTAFFQSLLNNVGFPGFWQKTAGFPAGFRCKAFLKKIPLDFLRNSGGFHQANPDLNPGGFPVEFHWDSSRILLGFQWNSSGIPVEILLGFQQKMLGFRLFFSWVMKLA